MTMTDILNSLLQEHLYRAAAIIAICMASMLIAMFADLVSGIRKAAANGEATTSRGLKKTCDKAQKYFIPYLTAACVDIIACIVIPIPVFSMIWSIYVCYCEFKSVREKSWEKAEIRKQERTISVLLENKNDIAKMIADIIRDNQKEDIQHEND